MDGISLDGLSCLGFLGLYGGNNESLRYTQLTLSDLTLAQCWTRIMINHVQIEGVEGRHRLLYIYARVGITRNVTRT